MSAMKTFGKALRQKTTENLFQLQVHSTVSNSQCLLFDKMWVENPIASKEKSYFVGLYRNQYPDAFLVLYKDATWDYPKDIIWLKDCIITSHRHVSELSISLICGNKTVLFRFDFTEARELWQKTVRNEIIDMELHRPTRPSSNCSSDRPTRPNSNCSSDGTDVNEDNTVTDDERFICLRRGRARTSTLKDLFNNNDTATEDIK